MPLHRRSPLSTRRQLRPVPRCPPLSASIRIGSGGWEVGIETGPERGGRRPNRACFQSGHQKRKTIPAQTWFQIGPLHSGRIGGRSGPDLEQPNEALLGHHRWLLAWLLPRTLFCWRCGLAAAPPPVSGLRPHYPVRSRWTPPPGSVPKKKDAAPHTRLTWTHVPGTSGPGGPVGRPMGCCRMLNIRRADVAVRR